MNLLLMELNHLGFRLTLHQVMQLLIMDLSKWNCTLDKVSVSCHIPTVFTSGRVK